MFKFKPLPTSGNSIKRYEVIYDGIAIGTVFSKKTSVMRWKQGRGGRALNGVKTVVAWFTEHDTWSHATRAEAAQHLVEQVKAG